MSDKPITGGCLCGQVTYEIAADPLMTIVCHCTNCQKQSGSAYSILIGVPAPAVTTHGSLKTYEDTGDSGGKVMRQFCPDCGSPIYSLLPSMPDLTIVKAGTLDDTAGLKPGMHVYCDSAQPWVTYEDGASKFGKNPG